MKKELSLTTPFRLWKESYMMYDTADTIAAIATPLGESGIGVIRISGSKAYAVGDAVFKSSSEVPLANRRDRSIQHGMIVSDDAGQSMKFCCSS